MATDAKTGSADESRRAPSKADAPKAVAHFTPGERAARGKAARAEVPRSSHAGWEAAPNRPDPVELLEDQARTRLPELVPIRYGRMLVSPFTFYRGAAYVMSADLADGVRTGLHVQLCGDAHLSNFGFFAAPDRRLVFSINDFDETLPGPFEWDVKRLAASFAVAGRDRAFDESIRNRVVTKVVREYRMAMARFAEMRNIELWYTRLDADTIVERLSNEMTGKEMKEMQADLAGVHTKDSLRALAKLCRPVDGELRIVGKAPIVTPIEDVLPDAEQDHLEETIRRMIRTYRRTLPRDRRKLLERYRYVHAARKVVGVGSVGTRAWILLLLGRDDGDPLFLQFKEAQASVLEPFLGRSEFTQHGQRVVEGQRMMQAAPDIMLGWERIETIDGETKDFYIRQLWDAKASAEVELMSPAGLEAYGVICGWTLARAHARSGDPIAIAAYLGTATGSIRRWRCSPRSTRTRTNAITAHCRRRPRAAASRSSQASEPCSRGSGWPKGSRESKPARRSASTESTPPRTASSISTIAGSRSRRPCSSRWSRSPPHGPATRRRSGALTRR